MVAQFNAARPKVFGHYRSRCNLLRLERGRLLGLLKDLSLIQLPEVIHGLRQQASLALALCLLVVVVAARQVLIAPMEKAAVAEDWGM